MCATKEVKSPSGRRASCPEPATKRSSGMRLKRNVFAGVATRKLLTASLSGNEVKKKSETDQPVKKGLRKYLNNNIPKLYHKQATVVTTCINSLLGSTVMLYYQTRRQLTFIPHIHACICLSESQPAFKVSTGTCVLPKS